MFDDFFKLHESQYRHVYGGIMLNLFFFSRLPIKLYYMCECGFYMYAVAALLGWETRRKDFSVTMSHHVITIILLAYSYLTR